MAISTAAAIAGSAVIGAIGSKLASNSQKKAINNATEAATENNDKSIALQREIYGNNHMTLNPYIQRGNAAGSQINALLGLGGAMQPIGGNAPITNGNQAQYGMTAPGALGGGTYTGPGSPYSTPGINGGGYNHYGVPINPAGIEASAIGYESGTNDLYVNTPNGPVPIANFSPQAQGYNPAQTGQQTAQPTGQTAEEAARSAFDIFRDSTGYQFRFDQGQNALDTSAAARGMIRSGPQMKALTEYGQGVASDEFGRYMGYLGNQQGVGLSGASALAGVGQSYANSVSNLNSQNASVLGNAAIARGNANSNMWAGLGSSFGTALGAFGK